MALATRSKRSAPAMPNGARGSSCCKGLTPIPYKLVTITSGFAGYNIWLFVLCSIIARGGRFFVVAVLLNRYGDPIRAEIEKRLGLWVAVLATCSRARICGRLSNDLKAAVKRFAGWQLQVTLAIMLDRPGHLIAQSTRQVAIPIGGAVDADDRRRRRVAARRRAAARTWGPGAANGSPRRRRRPNPHRRPRAKKIRACSTKSARCSTSCRA